MGLALLPGTYFPFSRHSTLIFLQRIHLPCVVGRLETASDSVGSSPISVILLRVYLWPKSGRERRNPRICVGTVREELSSDLECVMWGLEIRSRCSCVLLPWGRDRMSFHWPQEKRWNVTSPVQGRTWKHNQMHSNVAKTFYEIIHLTLTTML